MEDKSLNIVLMVLFGIPGVAMLILAWFLPYLSEARALALLSGAFGVFTALISWLRTRSANEHRTQQVPVEIEARNKG